MEKHRDSRVIEPWEEHEIDDVSNALVYLRREVQDETG